MKVTIELEVESVSDLRVKMLRAANGIGIEPGVAEIVPPEDSEPPKKKAPAKKGRKVNKPPLPKSKKEPLIIYPEPKEAFDALRELNDQKSMDAARELLAEFKCARITELKPDQRAAFIKRSQEILES